MLSDPASSRIVWQIFEGLVGLDARNQVVPMLAESWKPVDGGRKWAFRLRQGVQFHGSPSLEGRKAQPRTVSADDVVFSYEKMARGFGSFVFKGLIEGFDDYIKGQATNITGIAATGPDEITISLTKPDPSFIYRITSPYLSIMPRDVVEANSNTFGKSIAVGTGPFRLIHSSGTEVLLKRNERYWRGTTGNVEQLVFRVEKNPQFRMSGFEKGAYDVVELPAEFRPRFIRGSGLLPELSGRYGAFMAQTFNVHYLGMDAKQLADVSLRRAISLAVDREKIVSRLLAGGAIVARGPVPPGLQGYRSPLEPRADPEGAKRELAKSSYKGEELVFLVSSSPNHPDVAQAIQSDLLRCGIKTRIDLVDFNTFVTRLFKPDRPPLFMAYSEWIYSAPELLMEQFKSTATPNPNVFAYSSDEVDGLLEKLGRSENRTEINRLCGEIETVVAQAPPAVWLYHETHTYVGQHAIANFAVTGNNHWLLSELRKEP